MVAPAKSGIAWTGETHGVFDGGTSASGYHMDPNSYTIRHGPRMRRTGRSSGSDGDSMPSLYDQRNIRLLAEHTGLSEGYMLSGMMLLGTISFFGGRGGNCPPIRTSRMPGARFVNSPPPSPGVSFVVAPNGTAVPIPPGYNGRVANNSRGLVYQPPGAPNNASAIRIADPSQQYPVGYARVYNPHGQPINPLTGRPGSRAESHIPLDYDGGMQWP